MSTKLDVANCKKRSTNCASRESLRLVFRDFQSVGCANWRACRGFIVSAPSSNLSRSLDLSQYQACIRAAEPE